MSQSGANNNPYFLNENGVGYGSIRKTYPKSNEPAATENGRGMFYVTRNSEL